jgi:ABC-type spermidine/putrescine transport system permease subunit I
MISANQPTRATTAPSGGGRMRSKRAPSARVSDHLFAVIPTAWLAIFFLAPLAFTVVYSFGNSLFGAVELGFTLKNYQTALSGFYLSTFLRTVQFAITASALCLAVAFPVAYFIARKAGRFRTLALVLILIPYFSSFLVRVMSWQILLARGGVFEVMLNFLHLHDGPLDLLDTKTAVFIGMVYAYLPIAIVPLFVVLDRIPRAAAGSKPRPRRQPLPDILGRDAADGAAGHRHRRAFDRRADAGRDGDPKTARRQSRRADGAGDLVAISAIAELCAGLRHGGSGPGRSRRRRRRARSSHQGLCRGIGMSALPMDGRQKRLTDAGLTLWFALAILFLFAPLAISMIYSFNVGVVGKQTSNFTGWTLEWYPAAWNDLALRRSVQTSLYVAFWAALIALGMGASLGYALVRHPSPRVRKWLSGLTYILLIVPEVVIGVSLLLFYAVTGIPLGAATLIAGITPAAIAVTALDRAGPRPDARPEAGRSRRRSRQHAAEDALVHRPAAAFAGDPRRRADVLCVLLRQSGRRRLPDDADRQHAAGLSLWQPAIRPGALRLCGGDGRVPVHGDAARPRGALLPAFAKVRARPIGR